MKNLMYGSYYWVRMKENKEVMIAFFYDDGFGGAFQICGSEEIFGRNDFYVLERIPEYRK